MSYKEDIEKLRNNISLSNGFFFDEIQKVLAQKEKGDLSIDLDIKMKICNQAHSICVNVGRELDRILRRNK